MLEKFKLDAAVKAAVGLPGDILVALRGEVERAFAIDAGDGVIVGIQEIADAIVTLLTIAGFELDHVHESILREPVFLADDPRAADRPEVAPTMSLGKT